MRNVKVYEADDGTRFDNQQDCLARDALIAQVKLVMAPLGETPKAVIGGKGWVQHNLDTVNEAKGGILKLCCDHKLDSMSEAFKAPAKDVHPFSIVGKILDDTGGPLSDAWNRFCRIDTKGREHQQPYYAMNGPLPGQVCVEDRSKK